LLRLPHASIRHQRPPPLREVSQKAQWQSAEAQKYRAWSDCGGDLAIRFSDDFLLTQASLYWFTNTISTSFRPYYERAQGLVPKLERVEVPTAIAHFPADLGVPAPRSWVERRYHLTRYTEMLSGGHFAAHEEPELLVGGSAGSRSGSMDLCRSDLCR
jgi:hypothetical protein